MNSKQDKPVLPMPRVTYWIAFAATPTFVAMALITRVYGSDMLCSMAPDASLLTGMVPMYLLMGLFHASPWFKWLGQVRERRLSKHLVAPEA